MKKQRETDNAPSKNSRRDFLGKAGLALGTAVLPINIISAAPLHKDFHTDDKEPARMEVNLKQSGWNTYATRYVYAPVFTWQPLAGAAGYIVQWAHQSDTIARVVKMQSPEYDMINDWEKFSPGAVDMIAWAVDEKGNPLCSAWRKRFYKSPGYDGIAQKPGNWQSAIDKAMGYLLAPARDKVEDFEGDMPRSCWSCCEESISGQRRLTAFPALHHPSFIYTYLEYARQYPQGKYAPEALKQAKQYGEWLLKNRLPADWKCSLFPFSTIEQGRMEGYIEGKNITLFRAARVGEAMVTLYDRFHDDRYLEYARHIADILVSMQQPDGSWPYRIDPRNGKIVEAYTSNAASPARLLGILENIRPDVKYKASRLKAITWMLQNPVQTRLWQGMFEDISPKIPYQNLEHWDTNELIRYLSYYHPDDPVTVKIAEDLNRYIEDQFVIFQKGDMCITEHCPAPTVMEQYACYKPMEVHTGEWIMSLLTLNQATGKKEYLSKAINAGNSIIAAQQKNGALSTWGYDVRFERPLLTMDWPGCNAVAVFALLLLNSYIDPAAGSKRKKLPL
jgi:hypothetical protein